MKKSYKKIHHQQGVAALEFALVFLPLFLLMYGMLSYALVFSAKYALSESAAAGARAAVRYISANDNIEDRKTAACAQAAYGVEWLKNFGQNITITCSPNLLSKCGTPENPTIKCLSVSMELSGHMLPRILLPIPDHLSATSVTQISLKY